MHNGEQNAILLSLLTNSERNELLNKIAKHYGTTAEIILEEITSEGAEHLFDYIP